MAKGAAQLLYGPVLVYIPAGLQLRPAGGLLALVDPALPQQGGDRGQQGGEQQ